MKFEVTTMLPVHTTAVKRRLACGILLVVFQLNDVIASTATEEDDVICQIEGLKNMGVIYSYVF